MVTPVLSTYSTQRYDLRLKHWLSSISDSRTTGATIGSSPHPSTIISKVSSLTIQEPVMDSHSPGRPLSNRSSSNPTSSRWYEEHSGRVSTLTQIGFSEEALSNNTSATSFHPGAGECEQSLLTVERQDSKQLIRESSLSAAQVEAHIPTSSVDGFSEETSGENEDGGIRGQAHWISQLFVRTNKVCDSTSVIQARLGTRNTQALPPFFCSYRHYHPEYDSDDEYSNSSLSTSSSFSTSALTEYGEGNPVGDVVASTSTFAPPSASGRKFASPSFAVFASPAPPPCPTTRFRGPGSNTALPLNLADIDEEEPAIIETVSQRADHTVGLRDEDISFSTAPSLPTDGKAWWKFSFKKQRMVWAGSCPGLVGRHQGNAPESHLKPKRSVPTRHSPEHCNRGLKEPKTPPSPPLSPRLSSPTRATRHRWPRASSGMRKILSVVLPCVPVLFEGNGINDGNTGPEPYSRMPSFTAFLVGPWRKKNRQNRRQEGAEIETARTGMPKGVLVEVRIERQINHVVDY